MLVYRSALSILIAANVVLVWLLPVLPCQDVPQHLAYARILLDHARPDLAFHTYYSLPTHLQSYFVTHYILAWLAPPFTLLGAFRIVMTAYVVAVPLGFQSLARAAQHDSAHPPWPALLGILFIWNPVTALGFLPFMLTIPLFLFACAAALRCAVDPDAAPLQLLVVAGLTVALASLHIVAAGCFMLFVLLLALADPRTRGGRVAAVAIVAAVGATLLWSLVGESGLGAVKQVALGEAVRRTNGLEFITEAYGIVWRDLPTVLTEILWALFGPYRLGAVALVAVVLTGAAFFVWDLRRRDGTLESSAGWRCLRRAAIAFAVISFFMPFGFYVPTEVLFLNSRMLTLGVCLLAALVPSRLFERRGAQATLVAAMSFVVAHFAYHAVGFARESATALSLLREAQPTAMLMSLSFHDRSAHFGKEFRVTHFLPMYYTVLHGGLNTQFWSRYTEHLPIDYLPGKAPVNTMDWFPERFQASDLKDSRYLMIQAATAEEPADRRDAFGRLGRSLPDHTDLVGCNGLWCLYRVRNP